MKVPSWWNRKDDQLRSSTVDSGAHRVVRTRTDMLSERKKQSIPLHTHDEGQISNVNLRDYNFNTISHENNGHNIIIPAGHKFKSRNPRDAVTIEVDQKARPKSNQFFD